MYAFGCGEFNKAVDWFCGEEFSMEEQLFVLAVRNSLVEVVDEEFGAVESTLDELADI